jgi:hypothetical protein
MAFRVGELASLIEAGKGALEPPAREEKAD